jgi:hypothetical protein
MLHTSTRQSFIWGTGMIHPTSGIGTPDPARILAVRGKLTHRELVRNGVRVGDVPLGDPGFLISRLLPAERPTVPRFPLGLVPYVFDRAHPFFLEAARDPSIKLLDVCDPVDVFLAAMASCGAIASSSLHGLIFAEALGLPSLWLQVSDEVVGGTFKFADWFSLAGNPQRTPIRPAAFVSASKLTSACEPRHVEIDEQALLQALTPNVLAQCSEPPRPQRRLLPASVCRARPLPIFILSRNNADNLRRMISSCKRQTRPTETAIYDDDSDDDNTAALLLQLEQDGIWVYRRDDNGPPELVDRLNAAIQAFFCDWAEPSRYAVAGCDADFLSGDVGCLDLYDDLLDRFPRADSVGPAFAELSTEHTNIETVVNWRLPALGRGSSAASLAPRRCLILERAFDLEFSVYRAGKPLSTMMKTMRVGAPPELAAFAFTRHET